MRKRLPNLEFEKPKSNFMMPFLIKIYCHETSMEVMGIMYRCIHPGMESIHGLDDIMKSWSQVFQGEPFAIQPARVKIDIHGQTALCSCMEETPNGGQLEALNVYRREGGNWRMTLHMASPIVMRMTDSTGPGAS